VRSIRVDEHAAILDDRYILGLITQALKAARADLKTGRSQVVLKSTMLTTRVGALESAEQPRNKRLQPSAGRTIRSRRG
jgi:hypothetical protein